MPVSINFGELCPEQKYLSGIINPQEEDHQRASGSVARRNCTASNVPANERFSDGEQNRGNDSADRHVAPLETSVGQDLVDGGEQE